MPQSVRVVTIGGGAGQSTLLRALVRLPFVEPTAIVTTFDSGRSSGELKDRYGVLPYGDIQRCIAALSPLVGARDILSFRIPMPEDRQDHTGGNLLLTMLEQEYRRCVPVAQARSSAVQALERMFNIRGRVIPASLDDADIQGVFTDRSLARNEQRIDAFIQRGKRLRTLRLKPAVQGNPLAIDAIRSADLIIIGPGSWYTSVLPPLLPGGIHEAFIDSHAPVVWIMNLLTEGEDARAWSGEKWIHQLQYRIENPKRGIARVPSCILVNTEMFEESDSRRYGVENKWPLQPNIFPPLFLSLYLGNCRVVKTPLRSDPELARHDEELLASCVAELVPRLIGRPV